MSVIRAQDAFDAISVDCDQMDNGLSAVITIVDRRGQSLLTVDLRDSGCLWCVDDRMNQRQTNRFSSRPMGPAPGMPIRGASTAGGLIQRLIECASNPAV